MMGILLRLYQRPAPRPPIRSRRRYSTEVGKAVVSEKWVKVSDQFILSDSCRLDLVWLSRVMTEPWSR